MNTRSLAVTVALFFVSPALAQAADLTEGATCTPTIIGQALRAEFLDVVVVGDIAYVAAGRRGLLTLDITDPKNPAPLGDVDGSSDWAFALDVDNGVAYVATYTSGLRVFDVSNPAEPALLSALNIPGTTRDVAVSDGVAYVATTSNGLHIFDVADPANPVSLATYDTPNASEFGVQVLGNMAYIANGGAGLTILDVTDPANPALLGTQNTPGIAYSVSVSGNTAYIADWYNLQVIDVSNPASPNLIGELDLFGGTTKVTASGGAAFVASPNSPFCIVDVTTPANPTLVNTVGFNSFSSAILSNDRVLFAAYDKLLTVDVATLSNPSIVGAYEDDHLPHSALDVARDGDLCAVADSNHGLVLLDVSDPAQPTALGHVSMGSTAAVGVALSGGRAYVAAAQSGLRIVDISDPADPQILGSLDTEGIARRVTVSGDIAYLFVSQVGLHIIDVSDPNKPALLATFPSSSNTGDVAVVGTIAYFTGGGLNIIDVSDPVNPALLSTMSAGGASIAVVNNIAYVASGSSILVVDVANPRAPFFYPNGYAMPNPFANDITVAAGLAYVAGRDRMLILDLSDGASPTLHASVDIPFSFDPSVVEAVAVAISPGAAYVADSAEGVRIVDISACVCPGNIAPSDSSAHTVNVDDLLAVITAWGPCVNPGPACTADTNFDGVVDVDDLLVVISGWGPCP